MTVYYIADNIQNKERIRMRTLQVEEFVVETAVDVIRAIVRGESPVQLRTKAGIIHGEAVTVIDMQKPSIELLTNGSTSTEMVPRPNADYEIQQAMKSLLSGGVDFYTSLRNSWNMPSVRWHT